MRVLYNYRVRNKRDYNLNNKGYLKIESYEENYKFNCRTTCVSFGL
jgi:hypothetical protein